MSAANSTIKVTAAPTKSVSFAKVMTYIGYILLIAAVAAIIFLIAKSLNDYYNRSKDYVSNRPNNYRIIQERIQLYESMYIGSNERLTALQAEVKGLLAKLSGPGASASGPPSPNDADSISIAGLAADERALINFSVLTCDNAGYMGPLKDGVYSEENAIRIAARAGARAYVLRIDTVEETKDPVLVTRNFGGDKISNNTGSIKKVIDAIAQYAPSGPVAEPIIIILFFNRIPGGNAYNPEAQRFMQKVAESLGALRNRHLGLTPHGDFRRQAMSDKLFLFDRKEFDGKFIILTNADTKVFREKRVSPSEDLDLWTHARLYADTTEKIGITEVPQNSKMVSPRLETPLYFTNIPDERLPTATSRTKVEWTIAMDRYPSKAPPKKAELANMIDKLGVCSVPINLFDDDTQGLIDGPYAGAFYGKVSWRPKVKDLRYKRPQPIKLASPNKQLDAKGGLLPIPKV